MQRDTQEIVVCARTYGKVQDVWTRFLVMRIMIKGDQKLQNYIIVESHIPGAANDFKLLVLIMLARLKARIHLAEEQVPG